jgi:hypothetical protein
MAWPEGVTVVASSTPVRVPIDRPDGTRVGIVTACGHESDRETRDLSAGLSPLEGAVPEVALLHTQVTGSAEQSRHSPYAPSVLDHLRAAGFDYWALGHIHLPQSLSNDPPVHYSGSPQGRTPAEDGARGCLLVDLPATGRARVTFQELAPVRWVRLDVDGLSECQNLEDIVDRIAGAWRGWSASATAVVEPADAIAHVTLSGPCPMWRLVTDQDELCGLAETVRARLGLLWVDVFAPRVHPILDVDEHVDRPDVLGEALRLTRSMLEGTEPLPDLDEHELALPRLHEVRETAAYLSGLLDGSMEDVLARLVRPDAVGSGERR